MKKVTVIVGGILLLLFLYLVYVYHLHEGWNKSEQLIFAVGLIIAALNSLLMVYQKRKKTR